MLRLNSIVLILFTAGCASTFKQKTLSAMAIGAAGGLAIGLSRQENKTSNAVMWASIGSTSGAIYSLLMNDPDKELDQLKKESKSLREELEVLNSPKIERQTSAFFGAKVPEKYRALINPGEWRVSHIDQWIDEDENRLVHHDLIMELIPPSLNPVSKPLIRKEKQ